MNLLRRKSFRVTFLLAGSTETWSKIYIAEDYSEVEWKALETLASNNDRQSMIVAINRI